MLTQTYPAISMSYRNPTGNNTPARFLAVLALLFMLGAQVLESAHYHDASGESVASCVLCHSGAGTALPTSISSTAAIIAIGVLLLLLGPQKTLATVFTENLPRGPPGNT